MSYMCVIKVCVPINAWYNSNYEIRSDDDDVFDGDAIKHVIRNAKNKFTSVLYYSPAALVRVRNLRSDLVCIP